MSEPTTAPPTKTTPQLQPEMEVLPPSAMVRPWKGMPPEEEAEMMLTVSAERSFIEVMARMELGAELFDRRVDLIEKMYKAALRRTRPQDWVLSKDAQGTETAMLTASGAPLIAELYGIEIYNIRPVSTSGQFEPKKEASSRPGIYTLRAWCSAFSRANGRRLELLEFARRSDEQFTGRGVDEAGAITHSPREVVAALDADLRQSVMTGMVTKATKALAGMTRVPKADLDKAWDGTGKLSDQCRRGHGYGTGQERAAGAASGDLTGERERLKAELVRRTGGDAAEIRKLTKHITANPPKFAGFDSVDRVAQDWQLENAWKRLRGHDVYGDAKAGPETSGEREPGQD